jgi:hypothetical protein
MSSKPKSAQAIAISSVATKLPEETKVPQATKVPEGPKPTIVSAKVTKSIMTKAIEAKLKESPRTDECDANASMVPCGSLPTTDKPPVLDDTSVFAGLVMLTGMSMLADPSMVTQVSVTATDNSSLANHVSSNKVGEINIEAQ